MDTLRRIVKIMPAHKELDDFVKIVGEHYLSHFEKVISDIIVPGSNIPEDYCYALYIPIKYFFKYGIRYNTCI